MDWFTIILIIFNSIFWVMVTIREIKDVRNAAPHGKTFIKKFYNKITDITHAQMVVNIPYIKTRVNNIWFRVRVKEDSVPEGLEYSTIPRYKSYSIYVENEVVCRLHSLEVNFKKQQCVEFSNNRKHSEIIEIIDEAYLVARKELAEYNKKYLNINKSSFYDNTKR